LSIEAKIRGYFETAWLAGYTPHALARKIGIDPKTLNGVAPGRDYVIGPGGFNPTLGTIQKLEEELGGKEVAPTRANALGAAFGFPNLGLATAAREESVGAKVHSVRLMLVRPFVPFIAPQLHSIELYCNELKARHGALRENDLNMQVLRRLAPDARIHLSNAPEQEREAIWVHWDRAEDVFDGQDLKGLPVGCYGDDAFENEILGDLVCARESGIPLYHAIYRLAAVNADGVARVRVFFRLLQRLEAQDGCPKILWVAIRQDPMSVRDLFGDLLPV
jgi:hypothetical protein